MTKEEQQKQIEKINADTTSKIASLRAQIIRIEEEAEARKTSLALEAPKECEHSRVYADLENDIYMVGTRCEAGLGNNCLTWLPTKGWVAESGHSFERQVADKGLQDIGSFSDVFVLKSSVRKALKKEDEEGDSVLDWLTANKDENSYYGCRDTYAALQALGLID